MSKPYSFIPFLETKEFKATGEKLSGKIYLTIETLTPVHVSCDFYEVNKSQVLYKPFYKIGDKYTISGTSLKGIIRGIAESISNSCISVSKKYTGKLPNKKKSTCSTQSKGTNNNYKVQEPCIICNIFGAMGKRSKVRVSDFTLDEGKSEIIGIPLLRAPNDNNPKYLDDNNKYKGYKIYSHGIERILEKGKVACEFIVKGSKFSGHVIYEDISKEELSLLAFSLGITGDFHHKVGYGKPAYYGSINVSLDQEKTKNSEEILKAAMNYKVNSNLNIKKNIDILKNEYNYDKAKKISDWHDGMY